MQLTVGNLKKIFAEVDDDVVLAHLEFGNNKFSPFTQVKRVLLMKADSNWLDKTYLVINEMGSHFTGEGEQKGVTYVGKHWDENTLKSIDNKL